MPEDPEEVLPEQGISTLRDLVEVRAEEAIELEEDERDRDHGEGEHDEELRNERHPREDRHAHEVHPRRAHVDDRRDEVEARRQRRHTEDLEAENPEVDVEILRIGESREWRVAEPPTVGRRPNKPGNVQKNRTEQVYPIAEGVETGERHIPRADLQRDEQVEKCRAQWHDHEEDHGRAMHREQLVEHLRRYDASVREHQLEADDARLEATNEEPEQRGPQVQRGDAFMIDGRQPAP